MFYIVNIDKNLTYIYAMVIAHVQIFSIYLIVIINKLGL